MIECTQCKTTNSSMWHKKEIEGKIIGFVCQKCHNEFLRQFKQELAESIPFKINNICEVNTKSSKAVKRKRSTDKIFPAKKTKQFLQSDEYKDYLRIKTTNEYSSETRQIIKDQVKILKTNYTTLSNVRYNSINYEVGDIVSLVDAEDNEEYFAQCISFRIDSYQRKTVCYQWLFPDPATSWQKEQGFVPNKFKIGPSDNLFHPIESIQFVCSAPTNYFIPSTYYVNNDIDNSSHNVFHQHKDYLQVNIRP